MLDSEDINQELRDIIALLQITNDVLGSAPDYLPTLQEVAEEYKNNMLTLEKQIPCEGCGEYNYIDTYKTIDTGYIKAFEPLCKSCLKQHKSTAALTCVVCKRVVCRMEPTSDSAGFKFEKNKYYHLDSCPRCKPNANQSTVLEKTLYDKNNDKRK